MQERFARIDEAAIARMVRRFYERARGDERLGPVFERFVHDWPAHFARLDAFWSSVLLTSGRYKGNPFAAHLGRGIDPVMFDRWLALWRETAGELFEPEAAGAVIDKAERIGESLKSGMFFRTGGRDGRAAG